ncbi:MAG: GTPase HflX, partial [Microvirga sp.]
VSHGESDEQASDVEGVLRDLGIDPEDKRRVIEVWNKADLLNPDEHGRLDGSTRLTEGDSRPVLISALTGEGIPALLTAISQHLTAERLSFEIDVAPEDGRGFAWLHENTEILDRVVDQEGHSILKVRVTPGKQPRLLGRFPQARALNA